MGEDNQPVFRTWYYASVVIVSALACIGIAYCLLTFAFLPVWFSIPAIVFVSVFYFASLPDYMQSSSWTRTKAWLFFAQVLVTAVFIILLYAEIFAHLGLDKGGSFRWEDDHTVHSVANGTKEPQECLYFSLVTWTTLGYGDLQPAGNFCRFVAASEAFLQIIYLGTFIAVLTHIFPQVRKN